MSLYSTAENNHKDFKNAKTEYYSWKKYVYLSPSKD